VIRSAAAHRSRQRTTQLPIGSGGNSGPAGAKRVGLRRR
jgi:hypothetical protein